MAVFIRKEGGKAPTATDCAFPTKAGCGRHPVWPSGPVPRVCVCAPLHFLRRPAAVRLKDIDAIRLKRFVDRPGEALDAVDCHRRPFIRRIENIFGVKLGYHQ